MTHVPAPPPAPGVLRRLRPRQFPVLGPLLVAAHRLPSWRLKALIRWLLYKLEGGTVGSRSLRAIFREHFGVEVGDYTHGGWNVPFHLGRGTRVGRYSSIADTARTITHNHPTNTRSTSGLFFDPAFGLVAQLGQPVTDLAIGSDVWIGHQATILPSVRSIGHGAVVGAGAVVHRDVPPYAIVLGHPARVVGYRFDPATIERLLAERWWERELDELACQLGDFTTPLAPAAVTVAP